MAKFQIKISLLSPEARCNDHPMYEKKEILFSCENCSIKDAIENIVQHEDYQSFMRRNRILNEKDIYTYYTDEQGYWQYYRSID